jgi:hypothetical protein
LVGSRGFGRYGLQRQAGWYFRGNAVHGRGLSQWIWTLISKDRATPEPD